MRKERPAHSKGWSFEEEKDGTGSRIWIVKKDKQQWLWTENGGWAQLEGEHITESDGETPPQPELGTERDGARAAGTKAAQARHGRPQGEQHHGNTKRRRRGSKQVTTSEGAVPRGAHFEQERQAQGHKDASPMPAKPPQQQDITQGHEGETGKDRDRRCDGRREGRHWRARREGEEVKASCRDRVRLRSQDA